MEHLAGLDVASSTAMLDRRGAARDLWPGGTLRMWLGEESPWPERVWWPETDDEVAAVLRAAAERGVPVVPYGAGSGVCGGARGREGAWVIDLKRFDHIGQVDPERWVVEVGAGVNGQHLEDELARQGYTLGHSPSSISCSTVGGWIAARSAGQLSSRYGVLDDMVMGVDAVAPGPGPFRAGWAGPSSPDVEHDPRLISLLAGSEGTLAVITRARLRVRPIAEHRWLRGYQMGDVGSALDAMRRLMQAELWPSVVRLYDPVDTFVGGRTKPRPAEDGAGHHDRRAPAWWRAWLSRVEAVEPVRKRALVAPLALPGLLQRIAEGLSGGCLLIVGWEGRREVVDAAAAAGHQMLAEAGRDLGFEPGERWYASRHAVSYKLMPVFEHGGFADTMEIAGPWSVLPRAYAAVREAVSGTALVMAHMSHAYPEGGCIYFSFAGRGDRAVYERLWQRALQAVQRSGATATHHHGVGELKAETATQEVGPAIAGWLQAKAWLDPAGILNPGRLFRPGLPIVPPPEISLSPEDGLVRRPLVGGAPSVEGEPMWGWQAPEGPSPGAREPWQSTWIEVRGLVDGRPAAIGRGPRSACGPDLRPWLAEHGQQVSCSVAWAEHGERWLGEALPERPWAVARAILRADLRPAVLEVEDGQLRVGFRGPAAAALGMLAAELVPGGLREGRWRSPSRAAGAMIPCEDDDVRVVAVTCETAWRRAEGSEHG